MAHIEPFRALRYDPTRVSIPQVVTQPYDKTSPEMRARYLSLSPYNLVRIILGERGPSDTGQENVYTRARYNFNNWINHGILTRDAQPGLYA